MTRHKIITAIVLLVAWCVAGPAQGLTVISTGSFTPTSPIFLVPIEITGAADVVNWQFDLRFNPNDFQINLSCDPLTDKFCDPINGPVTEGSFTSKNGTALSLFVPGFADNSGGLLSIVSGAYQGIPPGPSGEGTLALVEFSVKPNGALNSPITIENALVTQGPNAVDEPPMLLWVFAALISALAYRRSRR
jgi:hypothetical protein